MQARYLACVQIINFSIRNRTLANDDFSNKMLKYVEIHCTEMAETAEMIYFALVVRPRLETEVRQP